MSKSSFSFKKALPIWLPFAIGITLLAGAAYFFVPRFAAANSTGPLARLAEQAVEKLEAGRPIPQVVPGQVNDIVRTPTPYLMVFDPQGNVLASSGSFRGQQPQVPSGLFTFLQGDGWDGAEWQPAPGIRQELAIRRYADGFVLAGRPVTSAQDGDPAVRRLIVALWVAALVSTLALVALRRRPLRAA